MEVHNTDAPPPYRPKTIDEIGCVPGSPPVLVLHNTQEGKVELVDKPLRTVDYATSQLASSNDLFLNTHSTLPTEVPTSPPRRNATMRAMANNSSNINAAFNTNIPCLKVVDGVAIPQVVTEPPAPVPKPISGRAKGVFHPDMPPSENHISSHSEISSLLKTIKKQMQEENIYGKDGKGRVNSAAGEKAVGPELAARMETLAQLLGRRPFAEECQLQPYSTTRTHPYTAHTGLLGAGKKYNIDYEQVLNESTKRAEKARLQRLQAREMLMGLGTIEAQLEQVENEQDRHLTSTKLSSTEDDSNHSGANGTCGEDKELTSARTLQAASTVLGVPITSEVLGELAQYGYHGRESGVAMKSPNHTKSTVIDKKLLLHEETGKLEQDMFDKLLRNLEIRTTPGFPKIRTSIFLDNLKYGVYCIDLSIVSYELLDLVLKCTELPYHTFSLHMTTASNVRLALEEKYRVAVPQTKYTSASKQPVSGFSFPKAVKLKKSEMNPTDPVHPYILASKLSKMLPRVLALHAPTITHLELVGLTLTSNAWVMIIQTLLQMPLLKILYIRQCNLSDEHVVSLVSVLTKLSISHVAVSGCGLGPSSAYSFARLLSGQAQRRDLYQWRTTLRNYKIPENIPEPIVRLESQDIIERLRPLGLLTLDVSHNRFGDEGVSELLQCVCSDTWITYLDVSANGADKQSIMSLAEMLALNQTLLGVRLEKGVNSTALVQNLDTFYLLRLMLRMQWYSEANYLTKCMDTNQMMQTYAEYTRLLESDPDLLKHMEYAPNEMQLQDFTLTGIPKYGSKGGRVVYPILDLVCTPSDVLQPLSHIINSGHVAQGTDANNKHVVMGSVYREGIHVELHPQLHPNMILDVNKLVKPLHRQHTSSTGTGSSTSRSKQVTQPFANSSNNKQRSSTSTSTTTGSPSSSSSSSSAYTQSGEIVINVPLLMQDLEHLVVSEKRYRHQQEMAAKEVATLNNTKYKHHYPTKRVVPSHNSRPKKVVRVHHTKLPSTGVAQDDLALQSDVDQLVATSPYWSNVIDALDAVLQKHKKDTTSSSSGNSKNTKPVNSTGTSTSKGGGVQRVSTSSSNRTGGGYLAPKDTKPRELTRIHKSTKPPVPRRDGTVTTKSSSTNTNSGAGATRSKQNIPLQVYPDAASSATPQPQQPSEEMLQCLGLSLQEYQQLSSQNPKVNPILAEALSEYLHNEKDIAAYTNTYLHSINDTMGIDPKVTIEKRQEKKDERTNQQVLQRAKEYTLDTQKYPLKKQETGAFSVLSQLEQYIEKLDAQDELDTSYEVPPIEDVENIYTVEDVQESTYEPIHHDFYGKHVDQNYQDIVQLLKEYTNSHTHLQ